MPSKKKKYNARFPPARIKKIMQTDDEVGKVAAPVPVIISRALELFVETLVKKSSEITKARNARTLTTSHLKACILADSQYQFLHELVANVPDVQAEDDGTPLPPMTLMEGQQTPVIVRHRSTRGRKPKNRNGDSNAGPSHSTAEESESVDDEDEEEDEDEEDSDCASSENTCDNASSLDTRPLVINHQSMPFNQMHNNSVSVINASNNNGEDDDDYDS